MRSTLSSLSNDGVDRFNFKWMVLLMLVLSLVSFIIPLHPSYQDQEEGWTLTKAQNTQQKSSKLPIVDVNCWCPAEFPDASVKYANSYCGNAFNAGIRGDESHVYLIPPDHELLHPRNKKVTISEYFKEFRDNTVETGKIKSRIQKLSTFQTPITLLLLGVCLILPQAIWVFLSESLSAFNVGQTLETVQGAEGLDAACGSQILGDVSFSVNSSSKMSGVLYLLKKILAVLVAVGLLIVISQHASPQVEQLETDLETHSPERHSSIPENYESSSETAAFTFDAYLMNISNSFLCDFQIRQLNMVHSHRIQCTVSHIRRKNEQFISRPSPNASLETSNRNNLLEFESTMLKIVTAFLVILVVANIVSLCVWISKLLTTSARNALGLSSSTALDIVFLVQMARVNTSVSTTNRLARTLASGGCQKAELHELVEDNK